MTSHDRWAEQAHERAEFTRQEGRDVARAGRGLVDRSEARLGRSYQALDRSQLRVARAAARRGRVRHA